MSRFISKHAGALTPYVPGEQPRERTYIKLNTNECPYPPSPALQAVLAGYDYGDFARYPDPEAGLPRQRLAARYGLFPEQVFLGNGSDEVLAFLCMAFFDKGDKIYFPDPSYGFYSIYAELFGLEACPIPLAEDYTLRVEDYLGLDGNLLIANPNAPTGMAVSRSEIERILRANPDRLVVVDEAYADFAAGEVTSLPLISQYDNLLIVGTFSKSRAMAGLRLGYGFSRPDIIGALERIKFSFNPYNVNDFTQRAAAAAAGDGEYQRDILKKICDTRERVAARLRELGLRVLPSSTNFVFTAHQKLRGKEFYEALRDKGILVRCFNHPRTLEFVRVSIGTDREMDAFLQAVEETL